MYVRLEKALDWEPQCKSKGQIAAGRSWYWAWSLVAVQFRVSTLIYALEVPPFLAGSYTAALHTVGG
jgi:hypothetical protein